MCRKFSKQPCLPGLTAVQGPACSPHPRSSFLAGKLCTSWGPPISQRPGWGRIGATGSSEIPGFSSHSIAYSFTTLTEFSCFPSFTCRKPRFLSTTLGLSGAAPEYYQVFLKQLFFFFWQTARNMTQRESTHTCLACGKCQILFWHCMTS